MKNSTSTKELLFVFGISIFTVVFSFAGLAEMFPLYITIPVYLVCLSVSIIFVWRWEKLEKKKTPWRVAVCVLFASVYCALMGFPVSKQYKRENSITITFKDSPYLPFWRKEIIRHDLTRISEYLRDLDIPISENIPPVGVQTGQGSGQCGSVTPPGLPSYRSELVIGEKSVDDRRSVTSCYLGFVLGLTQIRQPDDFNASELMQTVVLDDTFTAYLNASYWDAEPPRPVLGQPLANTLWTLRNSLGKDFTDHLVAASYRAFSDNPREAQDKSGLELDFAAKLKIGDSIIDNECSHWPKIEAAIVGLGVKPDSLRKQDLTHSGGITTACIEMWKNN